MLTHATPWLVPSNHPSSPSQRVGHTGYNTRPALTLTNLPTYQPQKNHHVQSTRHTEGGAGTAIPIAIGSPEGSGWPCPDSNRNFWYFSHQGKKYIL